MAKSCGNPNWGKVVPFNGIIPVSAFEQVVTTLKLTPDQYRHSEALREWASKNKDQKYVPVDLLAAWGMTVRERSE